MNQQRSHDVSRRVSLARTPLGPAKVGPGSPRAQVAPLRLDTLPQEVQLAIYKQFCEHCGEPAGLGEFSGQPNYQPLLSLCRVSQITRIIAQPLLFHVFRCDRTWFWKRLVPFARVLSEAPILASHVRWFICEHQRGRVRASLFRFDSAAMAAGSSSPRQPVPNSASAHATRRLLVGIPRAANPLAALVGAKKLEVLDVIVDGWSAPPQDDDEAGFARLRSMAISGFGARGSAKIETGGLLQLARDLRELELRDYPMSKDLCLDLARAVPGVEQLHLVNPKEAGGLKALPFITMLMEGLPKLSAVSIVLEEDANWHHGQPLDILAPLMLRKDELKTIYIKTKHPVINPRRLSEFSTLKTLRLFNDDRNSGGLTMSGHINLPRCLETLQLGLFTHQGVALFQAMVEELGNNVSDYEHLKRLEFYKFGSPKPDPTVFNDIPVDDTTKSAFRRAGVALQLTQTSRVPSHRRAVA